MKISGQCHCGEIAYEAELDPANVVVCHCTDCQALSGTAFRTVGIAPAETFKILKGRPKEYVKHGDSGNPRVQAFCGTCGSGLYATDPGDNPAAYNIRLGTADQRHDLAPQIEVWRQSALRWLPDNDDTKKYDQYPG